MPLIEKIRSENIEALKIISSFLGIFVLLVISKWTNLPIMIKAKTFMYPKKKYCKNDNDLAGKSSVPTP